MDAKTMADAERIGMHLDKKELIKKAWDIKDTILEVYSDPKYKKSMAWLSSMEKMIKTLCDKIDKSIFPSGSADWGYRFVWDYNEFRLVLVHLGELHYRDNEPYWDINSCITLVSVPVPYVSTAEYADIYGVNESTVRTQLRRGKLRAGKRYGHEWRIPVLAELPAARGYHTATYISHDTFGVSALDEIPSSIKDIENFRYASISQDAHDRKLFHIHLLVDGNFPQMGKQDLTVDTDTRERYECFLVSQPSVFWCEGSSEFLADEIYTKHKNVLLPHDINLWHVENR